jgi:mannose-1-phosphate guanylyltransferase
VGARPGAAPGTEVVGFCLAAGAGSRLYPLTRRVPKPLLAPAGRPLVDLAGEALLAAGAGRVVVNAHHGADLLAAHLRDLAARAGGPATDAGAGQPVLGAAPDPAARAAGGPASDAAGRLDLAARTAGGLASDAAAGGLASDAAAGLDRWQVVREPELLGTGGGLGNAHRLGLLGRGVVLVACADVVVHPADLAELLALVEGSGAQLAAGLVPARDDPLPFRLDAGRIAPDPAGGWASAGVYVIRAGALDAIPPGPSTLAESLLGPVCARGEALGLPLRHPWADAGTLGRFLAVSAGLLAGCWPYDLPPGRLLAAGGPGRGPVLVVDGAELAPGAVVAGPAVLDAGSRVGPGAVVSRAVVGPGARVGAGATVTGSVLGPGATVDPGATAAAALLPG